AAKPDALAGQVPAEGLAFQAGLSEGAGNKVECSVAGKPRAIELPGAVSWGKGQVAERAYTGRAGQTIEPPDVGDLEKDQAFTVAAWVKLPRTNVGGAVLARMDDGNGFRGWDLWVQNGSVGMHLINRWPDDALKVVTQARIKPNTWTHVLVSYDGSGKV